jgi:hypothetical protein
MQEEFRRWRSLPPEEVGIAVHCGSSRITPSRRLVVNVDPGYEMLTQTGTVKAAPEIGWLPDTLLQIKEAA